MRSNFAGFLLVFSYGCFLLAFPNFGPVSLKIIEKVNTSPYEFFSYFYISHITGIIFSAILLDRVVKRVKLLKLIVSLLISSSFFVVFKYQLITVIGFLMGVFVVILGSFFARFVEPWKRGRIFAVGAALSNVYFFFFLNYTTIDNLRILVLFSVLPMLTLYLLPDMTFERIPSRINRDLFYFSLPVFVFYLVGGIMYGVMEAAFREAGITIHVLFYAVIIILAGFIYDRIGRRSVALIGLVMISASLLLFPSRLHYSAYLIQSSFAFIDVFAMMVWVDIGVIGSEAKQYGIGMLFITLPIYLGFMLSNLFMFKINTFFAIILFVLSAFLVGSAKEPAPSPAEYMRWLVRR